MSRSYQFFHASVNEGMETFNIAFCARFSDDLLDELAKAAALKHDMVVVPEDVVEIRDYGGNLVVNGSADRIAEEDVYLF